MACQHLIYLLIPHNQIALCTQAVANILPDFGGFNIPEGISLLNSAIPLNRDNICITIVIVAELLAE